MWLVQAVIDNTANAWGALFAAAGAVGTSYILSTVKKTDFSVARNPFFRKIQPAITLLGAVAAPWVASQASSHVDISGLGAAPIATLATVVGAELLAMLKRSI
jgi:hypothetical protein